MKYTGGVISEKGDYRQKNQDRATFITPADLGGRVALGCVFDGIGSFADSEISAEMMLKGIEAWAAGVGNLYPTVYDSCTLADDLFETISELNEAVFDYRQDNSADIGCTLSVFLAVDAEFFAFHVGDSRIYKIGEEMEQISKDEVAVVEKDGKLRNLLANYIGKQREVWINRYYGSIEAGDVFLLCSDGLYKRVKREDFSLARISGKSNGAIESECKKMVELVYERGEKDNVSCVLLSANAK